MNLPFLAQARLRPFQLETTKPLKETNLNRFAFKCLLRSRSLRKVNGLRITIEMLNTTGVGGNTRILFSWFGQQVLNDLGFGIFELLCILLHNSRIRQTAINGNTPCTIKL